MKRNLIYTFQDHLEESLKDPEFKKIWEASEPEYLIADAMIKRRLAKNLSQRDLAKKVKTTQAVISRVESMNANPSLDLLKRIAAALDSKITFNFK
jgi:ribosome-binding protein aMBF1 (putative translation factor)